MARRPPVDSTFVMGYYPGESYETGVEGRETAVEDEPSWNGRDYAGVMELVDVRDSKSRGPCGRVGSTPTSGIHRTMLRAPGPVIESLAFLFVLSVNAHGCVDSLNTQGFFMV